MIHKYSLLQLIETMTPYVILGMFHFPGGGGSPGENQLLRGSPRESWLNHSTSNFKQSIFPVVTVCSRVLRPRDLQLQLFEKREEEK